MIRITPVVKQLLIINGLFFGATLLMGPQMDALFAMWFPEHPYFHYWQIFTYMFMHGGFMHILFNMYALYAFGSSMEYMWGKQKFLFFYISAGVGAILIHILVGYFKFESVVGELANAGISRSEIIALLSEGKYNPYWETLLGSDSRGLRDLISSFSSPTVGASGAIYGLLVAYAMTFPNAELFLMFIPFPVKAKYFIPILIGIDLFSGLRGQGIIGQGMTGGGGIAYFAHVGGALCGFLMMYYWKKR